MGLFKTLLGSVAEKAISQVKDALSDAMSEHAPKNTARPAAPATPRPEPEIVERTDAEWLAFFREILQTQFADYSVREDVPVTDIAGPAADEFKLYKTRPTQVYRAEWGKPYSFVLSQGGIPRAVVMLGSGHSHYSNVKYLISRMYCKKLGIPYINFYTQMPNEEEYVVGRINKFL